ncbi:MAG TPA: response regulator [Blastocatellia bacterium]|nr:response regulator [Blastocatellia bacterium]
MAHDKGILLVEDDFDLRDMMTVFLEGEGYDVTAVANGQEAIDFLLRSGRPKLILLDLMMPVMNGWEFRRSQRQDPRLSRIPVVIISADANVREEAVQLGADSYLTKPIEFDALLKIIRNYTESKN